MSIQHTSAPDWIDELSSPHSAPERLSLSAVGCEMEIRSNSRALVDKLADYFKEFPGTSAEPTVRITAIEAPAADLPLAYKLNPVPPEKKPKEAYVDFADGRIVRKVRTGMLFLVAPRQLLAYGPSVDNHNQVINFINAHLLGRHIDDGWLLLHAAGVALPQRGLALAGFSGAGKSTLALHVVARGAAFVSNDRLLVRRGKDGLEMRGIPKMPRINPGTILNNSYLSSTMSDEDAQAARCLPKHELWSLEQKYDASIDECFGPGRFKLEAPLQGLVVLNWKHVPDEMRIERVDLREREYLLEAFRKEPGLFYVRNGSGPIEFTANDYFDVLEDFPVYEISGGVDFDAAANACLAMMRARDVAVEA